MKPTVVLLTLILWAGCSVASAADYLVLDSSHPEFELGSVLPEGTQVRLSAGHSLLLMGDDGTEFRVQGEFRGALSEALPSAERREVVAGAVGSSRGLLNRPVYVPAVKKPSGGLEIGLGYLHGLQPRAPLRVVDTKGRDHDGRVKAVYAAHSEVQADSDEDSDYLRVRLEPRAFRNDKKLLGEGAAGAVGGDSPLQVRTIGNRLVVQDSREQMRIVAAVEIGQTGAGSARERLLGASRIRGLWEQSLAVRGENVSLDILRRSDAGEGFEPAVKGLETPELKNREVVRFEVKNHSPVRQRIHLTFVDSSGIWTPVEWQGEQWRVLEPNETWAVDGEIMAADVAVEYALLIAQPPGTPDLDTERLFHGYLPVTVRLAPETEVAVLKWYTRP